MNSGNEFRLAEYLSDDSERGIRAKIHYNFEFDTGAWRGVICYQLSQVFKLLRYKFSFKQ